MASFGKMSTSVNIPLPASRRINSPEGRPACREAGRLQYMTWYAYVLLSLKNGNLYKGITNDLERRISEHNLGKNRSTKINAHWKIVYFEKFMTQDEARN